MLPDGQENHYLQCPKYPKYIFCEKSILSRPQCCELYGIVGGVYCHIPNESRQSQMNIDCVEMLLLAISKVSPSWPSFLLK